MGEPKTVWRARRSHSSGKVLEGKDALEWLRSHREDKAPARGQPQQTMFKARDGSFTAVVSNQPYQGQAAAALPASETWECESMEVKGECPIFEKKNPVITVPWNLFNKWHELALKHKDEWIAYLIGEWFPERGEAVIEDFYFPPQKAGGTHCEPIVGSFEFLPRTIGTVHSHNTMNAFFSGTDTAHMNWQVEMVVNARGEMVGAMRIKFKCGEWGRSTTCKVKLSSVGDAAYDHALEEALKRGKEISAEKQQGNVQGPGEFVGHAWPPQ